MKFIPHLLCFLCGCFQMGRAANILHRDEFASQAFQTAYEKVASFFKTSGTPVTDYAHPSLRTEESGIHDRATAHFTFYKDNQCTQPDYFVDTKISRCSRFLGSSLPNLKLTVLEESGTKWIIGLQQTDEFCEPVNDPLPLAFPKNTCTSIGFFGFITFNLIAHPLKSIPGGGAAVVLYDNEVDCQISKHTNLARAQMVLTWPMGVCSVGSFEPLKIVSCDATSMKFNIDSANNGLCAPEAAVAGEIPTDPKCATVGLPFRDPHPYQVLCIADSGATTGGSS
jgi:hypothetical protein